MRTIMDIARKLTLFLLSILLTACGGNTSGGDESGSANSYNDSETFKDTGIVINEIMKSIHTYDSSEVKDENNLRLLGAIS